MKIVFIGAGSISFGRKQIVDVLGSRELKGRGVTLTLVDTNEAALERNLKVAELVKAHTGTDIRVEATTDRRQALPGAKYVIAALARKRMELWEQDFRIPASYGFRHGMGENGGPGALFHALRSLQLTMPVCRDMEELSPDAYLFSFTNPESRILHAVTRLTRLNGFGFCHGIFSAMEVLERYLGRPAEEFEIVSGGINHFYCILRVRDKATGRDCLEEMVRRAATDNTPGLSPLFKKMAEVFGVFSFPSDDHLGEYVSYGTEYTGIRWPFGAEGHRVPPGYFAKMASDLEDVAAGRKPIDEEFLRPSGELTVPVICDIELDRKTQRPAANVLNDGPYIDNLPASGIVEVPFIADAAGIHPLNIGPIPETFAAMIRTQMTIQDLVTEAYRTGSKKLLLQALLLDPVIDRIDAAERMLDEMLVLQKDYLPEFE